MTEIKGYSDINQFRKENDYQKTQKLFEQLGLTAEVEIHTPTVGVNVAHLATMKSVQDLREIFIDKSLNVAILGITSPEGPRDFQRLLKGLGAKFVSTTTVDISDGIFDQIKKTDLDQVSCLQRDARDTSLLPESQDIVLLDHLGNCCPPKIDREINLETVRILKPEGFAIINITTSELLHLSPLRKLIDFQSLNQIVNQSVIASLQSQIYDLEGLSQSFRGPLIEIEPNSSFVVFGEDQQGHGEWFRRIEDHLLTWLNNGLTIKEIKSRVGWDSHEPQLKCFRHNVILTKSV